MSEMVLNFLPYKLQLGLRHCRALRHASETQLPLDICTAKDTPAPLNATSHCLAYSEICKQPASAEPSGFTQRLKSFGNMTAAVAAAFILAALLAEGNSLSCTECSNTTSLSCSGVLKTCDNSQDSCITVLSQTKVAGKSETNLGRGCGTSSECDVTTSMSATSFSMKTSTRCCKSSGCTAVTPTLPSSSSTKNGLVCETCYSATSSCSTSETMNCTGEEKKCISYGYSMTGTVSSSMAIRGCATQSFCDVGSISETSGGTSLTIDLTCTDSSIRIGPGVFLPAVAALFLLNTAF